MSHFEFWISPKVIQIVSRHFWSIYTNIISFCWHNFHGRNFDTRRIFYEKLIFSLVGKGRKMTLDVENSDFSTNVSSFKKLYYSMFQVFDVSFNITFFFYFNIAFKFVTLNAINNFWVKYQWGHQTRCIDNGFTLLVSLYLWREK